MLNLEANSLCITKYKISRNIFFTADLVKVRIHILQSEVNDSRDSPYIWYKGDATAYMNM